MMKPMLAFGSIHRLTLVTQESAVRDEIIGLRWYFSTQKWPGPGSELFIDEPWRLEQMMVQHDFRLDESNPTITCSISSLLETNKWHTCRTVARQWIHESKDSWYDNSWRNWMLSQPTQSSMRCENPFHKALWHNTHTEAKQNEPTAPH